SGCAATGPAGSCSPAPATRGNCPAAGSARASTRVRRWSAGSPRRPASRRGWRRSATWSPTSPSRATRWCTPTGSCTTSGSAAVPRTTAPDGVTRPGCRCRRTPPGGGTDFGERADAGLLRELVEETAQHGRVTGLLDVSHYHNPRALGPERHPMDWHTVRVLYRVVVDTPGVPSVVEAAGGSTADAAWFDRADLGEVQLNEFA